MRVCPSVGWSVGPSVHRSVTRFFIAEFKPKSDLTSINAPAQRSLLLAGLSALLIIFSEILYRAGELLYHIPEHFPFKHSLFLHRGTSHASPRGYGHFLRISTAQAYTRLYKSLCQLADLSVCLLVCWKGFTFFSQKVI